MSNPTVIFNNTKSGLIYKAVNSLLIALFTLHALSIHGLSENLVFCFEGDGQINIESEGASFFNIQSERILHLDTQRSYDTLSLNTSQDHKDVPLSFLCTNEQKITRFNQTKTLHFLDSILNTAVEELPRSRVFQLASFIPPLIEDFITATLQTVVLLN